jgi:hypothetical protein
MHIMLLACILSYLIYRTLSLNVQMLSEGETFKHSNHDGLGAYKHINLQSPSATSIYLPPTAIATSTE